ncbi:MAG: hypothetical protein II127_01575 [Ruminococcus sp.]|nr:hypothetical protein [Ruminococcus sp.]
MAENKDNIHAGHRARMKKRFIEHGFQGMEQHEILEMVLYYAIPRKDTNQLAHRLLDRYGVLGKVCDTPVDVLERDFGLSESAAVLLKMVPALAQVYIDSKVDRKFINTETVIEVLRPKFIGATVERTVVALSDAKDKFILCDVIFEGSLSATESPIRKIVDLALRHNAKYVYLAHNHPSELCVPSRQDLEATRTISETLDGIGVVLVDHYIFTSNEHFSIRSYKHFSKLFVNRRYEI